MTIRVLIRRLLFMALLSVAWLPYAQTLAATADTTSKNGMDSLVSVDWLKQHLDDPDLVVLDCRVLISQAEDGSLLTLNGRDSYKSAHIPTAVFADLLEDLSDTDSQHQFAVPTPNAFAAAISKLGVGDNTRVVLYDNYNSVWAARVWWMLRWIGFDRAALLDGGFQAWQDAGFPISTAPENKPARKLTVAVRPELIADRHDVLAAIDDANVNVIDTLPEPQYRGEIQMYARPGHIRGATNVSMNQLRDESGQFKSLEVLDELIGGSREARTITYCGGGIAASSNAFIMTRLGFKDVAVYTASLQEWAADPSLPMEVSPDLESHQPSD